MTEDNVVQMPKRVTGGLAAISPEERRVRLLTAMLDVLRGDIEDMMPLTRMQRVELVTRFERFLDEFEEHERRPNGAA